MSARTLPVKKTAATQTLPGFQEKPLWFKIWRARTSYLLLLPFLILFSAFVLVPICWSAYLSMTSYTGANTNPPEFVGLQNFIDLVSIQIRPQPQVTDEATGELVFDCDGDEFASSAASAFTAETGIACVPEYGRARDFLDQGYRELTDYSILGTHYIVGSTDTRFWRAIQNTVLYAFTTVPLTAVCALGLALILRSNTLVNLFFRTVFFLPSVTSTIAVAVVWRWIFNGESYGFLNAILRNFGYDNVPFLATVSLTMPILVFLSVWGGMGYGMVLFLAGLQNIPAEYYEAAAIDGASRQQSFWGITLPLLRPTILYIAVTGLIGSFQVFDTLYILFRSVEQIGGILDSGLTVVPLLYDRGFNEFKLGYASAIAWVLFFVIFVLTLINLRIGRINDTD